MIYLGLTEYTQGKDIPRIQVVLFFHILKTLNRPAHIYLSDSLHFSAQSASSISLSYPRPNSLRMCNRAFLFIAPRR